MKLKFHQYIDTFWKGFLTDSSLNILSWAKELPFTYFEITYGRNAKAGLKINYTFKNPEKYSLSRVNKHDKARIIF